MIVFTLLVTTGNALKRQSSKLQVHMWLGLHIEILDVTKLLYFYLHQVPLPQRIDILLRKNLQREYIR